MFDLQSHKLEHITEAFTIWRREQSGMPTPSDILKLVKKIDTHVTRNRGVMTWSEFQQVHSEDWQEYKRHLKQHGMLSPKLMDTV